MTVDVAREGLGVGVTDRLLQTHDLRLLRHHVDEHVGGDAAVAVGEPLEEVGVDERAHAHRTTLVVDHAVGVRDLELAHVLGDGAHGAIPEQNRGVAVDDGDLRVVDLLDVLGEDAVGGLEDRGVALGVAGNEGQAEDAADHDRRDRCHRHDHHPAIGLGAKRPARRRDGEREEAEQADADDPRADHRALNVEGGMEPPVGSNECHDGHNRQEDERPPAPRGEAVHERAAGTRGVAGRPLPPEAVEQVLQARALAGHRGPFSIGRREDSTRSGAAASWGRAALLASRRSRSLARVCALRQGMCTIRLLIRYHAIIKPQLGALSRRTSILRCRTHPRRGRTHP